MNESLGLLEKGWRDYAGGFTPRLRLFFLLPTALIKSVPRARRIMGVICRMMYLMLFVLVDAPCQPRCMSLPSACPSQDGLYFTLFLSLFDDIL